MTASQNRACDLVRRYLAAMERRDLDEARRYLGAGARFVFPGGRRFSSVDEIVANSTGRYSRIEKTIHDVDATGNDEQALVIISGVLNGVFEDGEAFEAIRFIDRFLLRRGKIVDQRVWNDTAEHLLTKLTKTDGAES
ncbi:MAG: nuclear transport factor 2 family protein [Alphaproteobacteria bacterium]|nr:nuclear transport factor 2 family protein [Alphaproteobacteria bacterium]